MNYRGTNSIKDAFTFTVENIFPYREFNCFIQNWYMFRAKENHRLKIAGHFPYHQVLLGHCNKQKASSALKSSVSFRSFICFLTPDIFTWWTWKPHAPNRKAK